MYGKAPDCAGWSVSVASRWPVDVAEVDARGVPGVEGDAPVGVGGGGAAVGGLAALGAASLSSLPPHAAVISAALAVRKVRRFINGSSLSLTASFSGTGRANGRYPGVPDERGAGNQAGGV